MGTTMPERARRIRYAYPDGRDPLLAAWRAGGRETHWRWNDTDFWEFVAAEMARLAAAHARAYAKRKAERNGDVAVV